jgi:hypothetical protein
MGEPLRRLCVSCSVLGLGGCDTLVQYAACLNPVFPPVRMGERRGEGYNSIPITLVGQHFNIQSFEVRNTKLHEGSGYY